MFNELTHNLEQKRWVHCEITSDDSKRSIQKKYKKTSLMLTVIFTNLSNNYSIKLT